MKKLFCAFLLTVYSTTWITPCCARSCTRTVKPARASTASFSSGRRNDAYLVTVKGRKHFNYSDFSLFSPDYKKAGLLGPIDGARMEKITNDYVLAFFDKYLKGKESPLLKGPAADHPEVEFKSHGRQNKRHALKKGEAISAAS